MTGRAIRGLWLATLIIGFGILGVVIARLMRVQIVQDTVPLQWGMFHLGPIIDFILAYTIGRFLVRLYFPGVPHAARIRLLGVWAALMLMHNLVWWYPQTMGQIFSKAWVDEVEQISEPGSVFLVFVSVPFDEVLSAAHQRARSLPDGFVRATDRDVKTDGFRRNSDLRRD